MQGVEAEQLAELEEVGDAAGLLERLVERLVAAEHVHVGVELLAQRGDVGERLLQRLLAARHAAVVPQDVAELAVEVVDRVLALDRHEPPRLVVRPLASASRNAGSSAATGLLPSSGAR